MPTEQRRGSDERLEQLYQAEQRRQDDDRREQFYQAEQRRWSDERLEQFYREFREHRQLEEHEDAQHREILDALFRTEDKDRNIPPGLVQVMTRVAERIGAIEVAADRQKRFLGGVLFAFSCVGFVFTDTAHKIFAWLRTL